VTEPGTEPAAFHEGAAWLGALISGITAAPTSLEATVCRSHSLARPYVIFYRGVAGADLGFCCLIGPGGDLRSWLRWLRCVEAERDRLAEQLEYAALFRGRC
jgi:hypothetical protein